VLAVRERGGPTGFNSAIEDRRAKVIKERRKRLVQHYHDLAELGRCFQTQAVLAGLNPTECIDLRANFESREQELERLAPPSFARRQSNNCQCFVAWYCWSLDKDSGPKQIFRPSSKPSTTLTTSVIMLCYLRKRHTDSTRSAHRATEEICTMREFGRTWPS
jgi:hypothetical protein